jgi:hypothetical protein
MEPASDDPFEAGNIVLNEAAQPVPAAHPKQQAPENDPDDPFVS